MEGRYEGNRICRTAEGSLYNPVYEDMLERRSGKKEIDSQIPGREKRIHGKTKKLHHLSCGGHAYYRRRLLLLLAAAVIITFIFGAVGVHADPRGVSCSEDEFVYQVITVERGDTLWDIARTWSGSTNDDMDAYMDRIRDMNHIHGDNLKEGQLLLIYYGKSMAEDTLEIAGR